MSGFVIAVLALVAGALFLTRRAPGQEQEEPWRASLEEDEPLDLEAIRRAEEEWLEEEYLEEDEDGAEWEGEEWR